MDFSTNQPKSPTYVLLYYHNPMSRGSWPLHLKDSLILYVLFWLNLWFTNRQVKGEIHSSFFIVLGTCLKAHIHYLVGLPRETLYRGSSLGLWLVTPTGTSKGNSIFFLFDCFLVMVYKGPFTTIHIRGYTHTWVEKGILAICVMLITPFCVLELVTIHLALISVVYLNKSFKFTCLFRSIFHLGVCNWKWVLYGLLHHLSMCNMNPLLNPRARFI